METKKFSRGKGKVRAQISWNIKLIQVTQLRR